jgi:hypothetical protein
MGCPAVAIAITNFAGRRHKVSKSSNTAIVAASTSAAYQ